MKKFFTVMLAAWTVVFAAVMSGCSDFAFNPIGSWKIEQDTVYLNGEVAESVKAEDMTFETFYVFEKSGKGYMLVDSLRTFDFSYEYDDNSVFVTILSNGNEYVNEHTVEYKISDDEKSLVSTDESSVTDDDGTVYNFKEEITMKKV